MSNINQMPNRYTQEENLKTKNEQRKKQVAMNRIKVFGGALLCVLLVLVGIIFWQMHANSQMQQERIAKERQLEDLKEKEIELKERLKQLNSKEYITKIARSEYFLSNDDEVIFKLPDEEGKKNK